VDRDKADKEDKLTAHDNNHDPMPVIPMAQTETSKIPMAQTEMSNPDGARGTMPSLPRMRMEMSKKLVIAEDVYQIGEAANYDEDRKRRTARRRKVDISRFTCYSLLCFFCNPGSFPLRKERGFSGAVF